MSPVSHRRKILVSVAVVLLLAAGGVVAAGVAAWPMLKQWAAGQLQEATGRDLAIDGGLSLDLLTWTPSLVAEDVRLSNAAWGSRPDMARIERIGLVVDLKAIFRGEVRVTGLRLEGADLLLEEDAQGRRNWELGAADAGAAAVEAAVPEKRSELPRIEQIDIVDGRLRYVSPKLADPIEATFERLHAENRSDGIALSAEGVYQRKAFALEGQGGGIALLQDAEKPYPVTVSLKIGDTAARLSGTVADPIQFLGFDAELSLAGKTLAELYPTLGLPLPSSPAYELTGRLISDKGLWRLDGFRGRLGGSDMAGSLAVETAGKVPVLKAQVTSTALRMEDLQGFVGEDDDEGRSRAGTGRARDDEGGLSLPSEPFNLEKLHAVDAEVRFEGKRIVSGSWLLDEVSTRFTLKGGKLTMDPLRFGVVGGSVGGLLVVDAGRKVPELRADLRIRGLDFGALMKDVDPQKVTTGRIGGRAALAARGRSVREMALSADGRVLAFMSGGTIGNQVLEMVALDLPQLVQDWFSGGGQVWSINCAIFPFKVQGGVLRAERLVLDAPHDTILGAGYIDLRSETMLFELASRPRDFSLFNTPTSITIQGSLNSGEIEVDQLEIIGETLKKLLMAPIAPLLDRQDEELEPCRPVEQAARPRRQGR